MAKKVEKVKEVGKSVAEVDKGFGKKSVKMVRGGVRNKKRKVINATADINQEAVKKRFSGGAKSFENACKFLDLLQVPYRIVVCGGTREIHYKNKIQRFVITQNKDNRVGAACRAVLNDVRKFEEKHGKLKSEVRTTFYRNGGLFMQYIMQSGRDIDVIDVSACYWTIAKNSGVILQKTFDKYLDDKLLRLISIGNLNKSTSEITYRAGYPVDGSDKVEENYHAWVWHYVVYKAYELFQKINKKIGGQIFLFKTDCAYVSPKYTEKVKEALKEAGFSCTVERKKIVGYFRGRVVMENKQKVLSLSNFGVSKAMYELLPIVPVEPSLIRKHDREEREEMNNQPKALRPLEPNKDFENSQKEMYAEWERQYPLIKAGKSKLKKTTQNFIVREIEKKKKDGKK